MTKTPKDMHFYVKSAARRSLSRRETFNRKVSKREKYYGNFGTFTELFFKTVPYLSHCVTKRKLSANMFFHVSFAFGHE